MKINIAGIMENDVKDDAVCVDYLMQLSFPAITAYFIFSAIIASAIHQDTHEHMHNYAPCCSHLYSIYFPLMSKQIDF